MTLCKQSHFPVFTFPKLWIGKDGQFLAAFHCRSVYILVQLTGQEDSY